MMLNRLMELKEDENDDSGNSTPVKKFMKDMSQMMNGILDLERRGQLPDLEKTTTTNLLLRLTMKDAIFGEMQINQAQTWLSIMEGSRKRAGRASFGGEVTTSLPSVNAPCGQCQPVSKFVNQPKRSSRTPEMEAEAVVAVVEEVAAKTRTVTTTR